MPLLGPSPPTLPLQRRMGPPPGAPVVSSGAGAASFLFSAQATSPFGAGSGAISVTAAAAAQWSVSAVGTASLSLTAQATSTNIFPLTIDASGRYLKQADGNPFLICGDTTWSLFVDIPLAGLDAFLNDITAKGFNAVSGNAIEHKYSVVNPPKERTGLLPFTQKMDGTSYTGSPNGNTTAGGTQGQFAANNYSNINNQAPDCTFINNSYWVNVETILGACLAHNVAVFVWPGYLGFHNNDEGWLNEMVVWDAVTGAGGFTGASFANPAKSKMWNYGAWLAARWKNYPHIVWVMGGDYGSGGQSLNTQQAAAVSNLMAGLKSVAGQQSLFYTAHWDRISIATDTALAAGSFDINGSYCGEEVAETTRRAYSHSPTSPAMVIEYYYEDDLFGGSAPYRKYMYWGYLSGIAGGLFGHEQLWRFDDGTPGTDYTTLLNTTGTLDAQRQFALWKSLPWHRLKPSGLGGMGTIITAGGGTASPQSTTYVAAAATPEGDLLLAYIPPDHTGTITVDMTKMNATARARWFDPTNGSFTSIGAFANTGTHVFTPPALNNAGDTDFLLVLETSAGTVSFAFGATAVGASLVAVAGSAAITFNAPAVGQSTAQAAGSASFALAATGVSGVVIQGVGSSSFAVTAGAVGARIVTAAGTATTATLTAAAVGTATATATGQATVAFTAAAEGSSTSTGPSTAEASFAMTAAAVGAARAAGAGTATLTFTTIAIAQIVGAQAAEPTGFAKLVAEMDDVIISLLG